MGALAAVRECRPNVVVSDIGLPGLDGFELARRLRAAEAGFDAYFVKPVDIQALLQTIASK